MTRASLIWFVGAVITGAVAAGLHLLRSEVGGGHDSVSLTVEAWLVTALTAFLVYRGVMTAAGEQDEAERRGSTRRAVPGWVATADAHGDGGQPDLTGQVETRSRRPR